MSFTIEDYPDEVADHPSDQSYTLKVRPLSASGVPLRGAMVKYLSPEDMSTSADTFDGTTLASFNARGGEVPRGFVVVEHYGHRVSWSLVGDNTGSESELVQIGTTEYRMDLQGGISNAPEQFNGFNDLHWIGDELVGTWTPPRHGSAGAYAVAGASDTEIYPTYVADPDGLEKDSFLELTDPSDIKTAQRGESPYEGWVYFSVSKPVSTAGGTALVPVEFTLLREADVSYFQIKKELTSTFDVPIEVGVKTLNQDTTGVNHTVSTYDDNSGYDSGSNVTEVVISPDPGAAVTGDSYILTANVNGDGNHDPTVSWSSAGPDIVTEGPRRCLIEATESGEVTATSNGDSTKSDSITLSVSEYPADTTPPDPSGVSWINSRPPGTVQISWDDTVGPFSFYRLYLSDNESDLTSSPYLDTYRLQTNVGGLTLGETYHAGLVAVHPDGNESGMFKFTVTPEDVSGKKAGRRTTPPKEQKIAPGDSRTVDLSSHVHLTPTNNSSNQDQLWSSADVTVRRVEQGSPIDVSVSGPDVTFSASGSVDENRAPEPVLIKIENGDRTPLWVGTMVTTANSTGTGPAQITDVPAQHVEPFEASAVVGDDPSVEILGRWEPKIEQTAHLAGISLDEGTVEIDPGEEREGVPAVAALSGEDGNSLIVISRHPETINTLPQLPSTDLVEAEKQPGNWSVLPGNWLDELGGGSATNRWFRVLTGSDKLFDVSLLEPSQELRYQGGPTYYQNYWLDEEQYPPDGELNPEEGRVEYRGGLKSPSAGSVDPTVEEFETEPGTGRVWVNWEVSLNGETREELVVPVELWPQGNSSDSVTKNGQGNVTFLGLSAGTTYVVDLFGTQDTAEVLHAPADAAVVGFANGDGTYTYRYDVNADNLVDWTDHFGNTHSPGETEVSSSDSVAKHTIHLNWANESRERTIETKWQLPPGTISFEKEVKTGRAVVSSEAETPTFRARRFSGERVVQLAYNFYEAGSWEVYPVGYLPLSAEGEIEDFVSAQFVGPGGDPMGQSVQTERAAEMAVQLTVEAANSFSPIVFGVRVEQAS